MSFDPRHQRRETLAHCLRMAEQDEAYAKWAASEYERNPIYGGVFEGMRARFDTEWARVKADREAVNA